jgi:hypothetical protein
VSNEQTTDQSLRDPRLLALGGSRPLFQEEVRSRVAAGARLVRFEYCVSLILFTIRRQSRVYLTRSWQERYLRGLAYSLIAIGLGPWGVPWGLIYTPWSVWVNLTGGVDETDAVLGMLERGADRLTDLNIPLPAAGSTGTD